MKEPQIIFSGDVGHHNADPAKTRERLAKARAYEDLSTVCVVPTRGKIDARVVDSWMSLAPQMNQSFVRMFMKGLEVGDAYNIAIETILAHEILRDFRYVLTLEEDNAPQPDGLHKLYENISEFDVLGGLYWTKGWAGQPMIYGRPGSIPRFTPQMPSEKEWGTVIPCNGLGMGFTLFRMDVFRDMEPPWFKTVQDWDPHGGVQLMTQDLYFFDRAVTAGKRIACDTSVLVAHYDDREDRLW